MATALAREIIAAARLGWRLFPVKARDKRPLLKDWQNVATCDLMQIAAWAEQYGDCNWGCMTGAASDIFVLDVDGEPGNASILCLHNQGHILPETRLHQTARGSHLFFRWPAGMDIRNSASKLDDGLDIRGTGGYVVIPPSIHPNGARYTCPDESASIADAPAWLLDMLLHPAVPRSATASKSASSIGPGRRTPLLFKMAGKLRAEGVQADGIVSALRGLNATFDPPLEDAKVFRISSGVERYPSGKPSGTRSPELICLADVQATPVSWLWKPYLAFGMLAMLSGDPDAGKTFISLAIAADLSNGRTPVSGAPCAPISTLYLSRENAAEHVIRPRYDALGGDARCFHLLKGSIFQDGEGSTKSGVTLKEIDVIEAAIQQTGAKLVVIDPIQSYLGAEVDAHRSNETRPVMDGLIALAEKHHACVLVVRHLSKASGGRAIHRGLGSIDLTGAVRMEMLAGNAAGDHSSRALVQIKNNVGPRGDSLGYVITGEEMEAKLEWCGKSSLTSDDLLAPDAQAEERTDIAEATDFLREQLAAGPKSQKEIVEGSGFSERTMQRAARKIVVQRSRDGERGPWLWSLK